MNKLTFLFTFKSIQPRCVSFFHIRLSAAVGDI